MIFGVGERHEYALSRQYQAGLWNGQKIGLFEQGEVRDGILYIGDRPSDYPADSSRFYYVPPVVSVEKGTWFASTVSGYEHDLIMRCDNRGVTVKTIDFTQFIGTDTLEAEVRPSSDKTMIEVVLYKEKKKVTYSFYVDPDRLSLLSLSEYYDIADVDT